MDFSKNFKFFIILILLIAFACKSKNLKKQKIETCIKQNAIDSFIKDTTFLKNNAYLFWKNNDGEFEYYLHTVKDENVLIKKCLDHFFCSQIGESFIEEYPEYYFFIDELISGCCTSPNIIFRDKKSGKIIDSIESHHFVFGDEKIILYSKNENNLDFVVKDLQRNVKFQLKIPAISELIKETHPIQLADCVKSAEMKDTKLKLVFLKGKNVLDSIVYYLKE